MDGRLKIIAAGLLLLLGAQSQAAGPKACVQQTPEALYEEAWRGQYNALTPEQATAALALFSAALNWTATTPVAEIERLARHQHMQAINLCPQTAAGPFLVLKESSGHQHGRGLFLFAPKHADAAVMQVPHARADRHTGTLGLSLLQQGKVAALALNTVPRRQLAATHEQGYARSDLAHTRYSYFQTMAEALARSRYQHALVQLHGFSNDNRRSLAGMQADIIVSNGSNNVSPYSRAVSTCLQAHNSWRVELYPVTIRELGATQNVTAQLYQRLGEAAFLHLELAYPLRNQMRNDNDALMTLGSCL